MGGSRLGKHRLLFAVGHSPALLKLLHESWGEDPWAHEALAGEGEQLRTGHWAAR